MNGARDTVTEGTLAAAVPVPLVSYDGWGYVTGWNPAAARLLGWTEAEVVGRRDPSVPPDEMREFEDILAVVLRGETVEGLEVNRCARCGEQVALSLTIGPLLSRGDTPSGAIGILTDISEHKRVEEEKDAFLVAVTHDLKTPLMVVRGVGQFLLRRLRTEGTVDRAELERQLEQVVETSGNITSSLNGLIDVTRIHLGRSLELERRDTDLVTLVRRVVAEQQTRVRDHQIDVEATEPAFVGNWDSFRLERVISNLVANAVKYSPPGRVTVRIARERPDWVLLAVRDEGIGIPRADVPRIFERFYRAQNVIGVIPGSGIGLAGVRQIVEQHGGTVEVDSREGQGTTFVVRLPTDR